MPIDRPVEIVGGGLAGMTVAYALAKQGVSVTLYEKSNRLGGKAGANYDESLDMHLDHGFHIFPLWYANVLGLLADLGLSDRLVFTDAQHNVVPSPRAGQPARWYTNYAVNSWKNVLHNFRNSPLRWHQSVVGSYFLLDLAAEPLEQSGFLDRVSVSGLFRSRFYRHEGIAEFQHFIGLQATSIPGDVMSAKTFQQVVRGFMQYRSKLVGMLVGDLQTEFILPFQRRLTDLGVNIVLNCTQPRLTLAPGGRAALAGPASQKDASDAPPIVVLATPPQETLDFVYADLYARERSIAPQDEDDAAKPLSGLGNLVSEPMAALHVWFKRRLPHIPPWHTGLFRSHYSISFIDISQHWESLRDKPQTVLSVIAANFKELTSVADRDLQARYIIDELLTYIRFDNDGTEVVTVDDVEKFRLNPNTEAKLLLNTTSAWHYRPDGRTRIPDLYVTGDYCRSQADLTSMEGAVYSGFRTAQLVLSQLGLDPSAAEPREFKVLPRWKLIRNKWSLSWLIGIIGSCYAVSRRWTAWRNRVTDQPGA